MTQVLPVKIELFYEDLEGEPLYNPDYPTSVVLEDVFFVEELTEEIICKALRDLMFALELPDGVTLHWSAVDSLPEGIEN